MARHIKARKFYPTIAIIGEGIVEHIYFTQLRQTEQLSYTVKPDLPKNPSASSIIEKAKKILRKGFDLVFCIFDMDQINRNHQTREQYEKLKRKNQHKKLIFIENDPCMEFWFLLHYEQTTRTFDNYAQLDAALKRYINDYDKNEIYLTRKKLYDFLKPRQLQACRNASLADTPENTGSRSQAYKILDFLKITKL